MEVLVVDRIKDIALKKSIEALKTKITPDMDESQKAFTLMKHIEEIFRHSEEKGFILIKNGEKKNIEETFHIWISDRLPKKEILIGDFIEKGESHIRPGIGVCRHRALLAQVLGKEIGLDISLARGRVGKGTDSGLHAWNEIIVKGEKIVYDPMNLRAINLKTKKLFTINKSDITSNLSEIKNNKSKIEENIKEIKNNKSKIEEKIKEIKNYKSALDKIEKIKSNESIIKSYEDCIQTTESTIKSYEDCIQTTDSLNNSYKDKILSLQKVDIDWYNAYQHSA
jgi:hypothetical protein